MAYYPPSVGGYQPPQMQMMPQAPSYPPMTQNATTGQQGFTVRPVASREEAMAVQTDFWGAGILLPCLGQGIIFLKRFNPNTGASDLLEFAYTPPQQNTTQYVTLDVFQQLFQRVETLEKKGVVTHGADE